MRAGEEGSDLNLARDDAGAAQCVEVLLRTENDPRDDPGTLVDDGLSAGMSTAVDDGSVAGVTAAAASFFT